MSPTSVSSAYLQSLGAVVASTVDYLWTDRPVNFIVADSLFVPASFPAPSSAESQKVSYHAGWTIKRARENVSLRRRDYCSMGPGRKEVTCSPQQVLLLVEKLGQDKLDGQTRRYLFCPYEDVAAFISVLHDYVQGHLCSKVCSKFLQHLCMYLHSYFCLSSSMIRFCVRPQKSNKLVSGWKKHQFRLSWKYNLFISFILDYFQATYILYNYIFINNIY